MVKNAIIIGVGFSDNASKQLDAMANRIRAKARTLASVGQELTMGISLPIIAAGGATLKFAGDLDALKRALAANMGGAAAAAKEFENLRKAAEAPGIGLEEAVRGSMLLQGLGDTADEARRQMLAFGKAVALSGGGSEAFGGLMHQFTQMRGVGKILGQDVRIMIENAPILGRVLNDAFGTASPEKLREMGVSVEEFASKVIAGLEKMQGVGSSLKNDLENLWTSIRVGVGEMGLAAIGATNMQDGVAKLSKWVQELTYEITQWIKLHPELTKNIGISLLTIGATGPIIRFIGDMGLATSAVIALFGSLSKIPGALVTIDKTSKLMSLSAFGWVGVAAASVWALVEAVESLDAAMYKNADGTRKQFTDEKTGRKYTQAFAGRGSGRRYISEVTDPAILSAQTLFGDFIAGSGVAQPFAGYQDPSIVTTPRNKPQAPSTPTESKGPYLYDPAFDSSSMYSSTPEDRPVPQFWETPKLPMLGVPKDFKEKIEAAATIMDDFKKATQDANIQFSMSGDLMELMKSRVGALAEKYRALAGEYGTNSEMAVSALAEWRTAQDSLNQSIKEQAKAEEQRSMAMQIAQTAASGLTEGLLELVTKGKSGLESFKKTVLSTVESILKMVVVQAISKLLVTAFFPGAAVAAGAGFAAQIGGLLGSVSLAKGGVVNGETIIRAGEYPNAHINPEVISPVNIMQKYIRQAVSEAGGGATSIGLGVHGDYLIPLISRAQDRHNRRGSGNTITF